MLKTHTAISWRNLSADGRSYERHYLTGPDGTGATAHCGRIVPLDRVFKAGDTTPIHGACVPCGRAFEKHHPLVYSAVIETGATGETGPNHGSAT